ncbi:hypothetical protein Tco_0812168 [Tanacetum coccineum]
MPSGMIVNAAVVVDHLKNEVIARACDQVHSCSCSINHEVTNSSSLAYSIQSHDNMLLNSSASELKLHAAIVAIEHSAVRDRCLFPSSGHVFAEIDHV